MSPRYIACRIQLIFNSAGIIKTMIISDEIYNESFDLPAEDPYGKSLVLKEKLSGLGKTIEKKSELWTDGPENRSVVEFSIIDVIDHYSRVSADFVMKGSKESKLLEVSVKIQITTTVKEEGFFSAAFAEYYMKTSYAEMSKMCRVSANNLKKEVENLLKEKISN